MNTEQFFGAIDANLNSFNDLYPSLQISHEYQFCYSDEFNSVWEL